MVDFQRTFNVTEAPNSAIIVSVPLAAAVFGSIVSLIFDIFRVVFCFLMILLQIIKKKSNTYTYIFHKIKEDISITNKKGKTLIPLKLSGPTADRIGRRNYFYVATSIKFIGSLVQITAISFGTLLLGRIIAFSAIG